MDDDDVAARHLRALIFIEQGLPEQLYLPLDLPPFAPPSSSWYLPIHCWLVHPSPYFCTTTSTATVKQLLPRSTRGLRNG